MAAETPTRPANRPLLLFVVSGVLAMFFVGWTWLVLDPAGSLVAFDRQCADFWKERDGGQAPEAIAYLTDLGGIATNGMTPIMGGLLRGPAWGPPFGTAVFAVL